MLKRGFFNFCLYAGTILWLVLSDKSSKPTRALWLLSAFFVTNAPEVGVVTLSLLEMWSSPLLALSVPFTGRPKLSRACLWSQVLLIEYVKLIWNVSVQSNTKISRKQICRNNYLNSASLSSISRSSSEIFDLGRAVNLFCYTGPGPLFRLTDSQRRKVHVGLRLTVWKTR